LPLNTLKNQNLTTDDTDDTDEPAWAMRPTLSDENGFEKEQNSLAGTKRIDLCNGGEIPVDEPDSADV